MTESEWLACRDPGAMLEFVRGKASDRKLRLFACACASRVLKPGGSHRKWNILTAVERYADGATEHGEVQSILAEELRLIEPDHEHVLDGLDFSRYLGTTFLLRGLASQDARSAVAAVMPNAWELAADGRGEVSTQCGLLRDIVNPFRPVTLDPAWLTPNVALLAGDIYQGHAFDQLPTLANALVDAGCTNEPILDHLRSPGLHVHGCWALDLVLGKE